MDYIRAAMHNAAASGLDLGDVIAMAEHAETPEAFDAAVDMLGETEPSGNPPMTAHITLRDASGEVLQSVEWTVSSCHMNFEARRRVDAEGWSVLDDTPDRQLISMELRLVGPSEPRGAAWVAGEWVEVR